MCKLQGWKRCFVKSVLPYRFLVKGDLKHGVGGPVTLSRLSFEFYIGFSEEKTDWVPNY